MTTSQTVSPRLTPAFVEALQYAVQKHATQTRTGSGTPYLGHLLSVAGLVIEADGTESQAIAALLRDVTEDQGGGKETLAEIREKFGADVALIVSECSDTVATAKPTWRTRKENYIRCLQDASDEAILVSLADTLQSARALLRDFRDLGDELWERFVVRDPQDHLWYYRSLLEVYTDRLDNWMVDELRDVIGALEREVSKAA